MNDDIRITGLVITDLVNLDKSFNLSDSAPYLHASHGGLQQNDETLITFV